MSDLENKKTEETPKKRPYNLREKKEKKAAYRSLIRPELADELYDKILNIVVVQKKYRDADYSTFSKSMGFTLCGIALEPTSPALIFCLKYSIEMYCQKSRFIPGDTDTTWSVRKNG